MHAVSPGLKIDCEFTPAQAKFWSSAVAFHVQTRLSEEAGIEATTREIEDWSQEQVTEVVQWLNVCWRLKWATPLPGDLRDPWPSVVRAVVLRESADLVAMPAHRERGTS